jgi:hypothetical protein
MDCSELSHIYFNIAVYATQYAFEREIKEQDFPVLS